MEKNFKQFLNIPNILSIFRMILIPVFVYLYMIASAEVREYYVYAAAVLVLSGLTDLFDGVIARRFNMITNLGKILDPLADKLTQVAVVISVAIKMQSLTLAAALMIFVVKEILMLIGGVIMLKRKITIRGSKWYGKVATAVFYVVMAAIALFDSITIEIALYMVLFAAFFMLLAFSQYIREYFKIMKENKTETI